MKVNKKARIVGISAKYISGVVFNSAPAVDEHRDHLGCSLAVVADMAVHILVEVVVHTLAGVAVHTLAEAEGQNHHQP